MSRKRAVLSLGTLLALALLASGAGWVAWHRPAFYRAALVPHQTPEIRSTRAIQFEQATVRLVDGIRNDEEWSQEFSEEIVNCWLADELPKKFAKLLPPDVQEPRVRFDQDRLQIAWQTARGAWKGVVSVSVRAWVAGPNELACQFESLKAGLLPLPADEILAELVDELSRDGWQVEWKQSKGEDVLVLTLSEGEFLSAGSAKAVLDSIDVQPGKLRISGRRKPATTVRRAESGSLSQ